MTISITVAGVAYPSPSSAADVDWAAQQVALLQALAAAGTTNTTNIATNTSAIAANATIAAVTDLTLAGNWTNDDAPQHASHYVDRHRCYLVGIPSNVSDSGGTVVSTLPLGARPAALIVLPVVTLIDPTSFGVAAPLSLGNLAIDTAGVMTFEGFGAGGHTAIVLDGLSFRVA